MFVCVYECCWYAVPLVIFAIYSYRNVWGGQWACQGGNWLAAHFPLPYYSNVQHFCYYSYASNIYLYSHNILKITYGNLSPKIKLLENEVEHNYDWFLKLWSIVKIFVIMSVVFAVYFVEQTFVQHLLCTTCHSGSRYTRIMCMGPAL